MTQVKSSISSEYEAALNKLAYFPLSGAGYLRVSGPDSQAFLQRQTTNDVGLLSPGRALVSVLTSPTGRILDALTLVSEPDAIGALTLPGLGAETYHYLRSRIFFMDKVKIEDTGSKFTQLELLGTDVQSVFQILGLASAPEDDQTQTGEIAGFPVQVIHTKETGLRLLAPSEGADALLAGLEQAGAARLSPETYNLLRIESGCPGAGHELVEDYTPLEAGLESAISDSKGCYTGQEVLARQVTYDKVTRHLAGLSLEGEASAGESLWSPEEERSAGTITSAAYSPRFGHIALAILRRPHHIPGTPLRAGDKERGPGAKVVSLPFEKKGAGG